MDTPAKRAVNICKLVVVMATTVLWSGCAPSVKMTVQVSDATGNSKGQFTVSSTDSGPTNFTVANGDNIVVTPTAAYSYGLQQFRAEGESSCTVCTGAICVLQSGALLAPPPLGNAIQPGTSPTQASFTTAGFGPIQCSGTFEMDLDAVAVGNPSPGLFGGPWFGGGPSTAQTQTAILTSSPPPPRHKK
jgi:hypothetical protein